MEKGCWVGCLDRSKGRSHGDGNRRLLLYALCVAEKEELVFDDGAADASTELITLEGGINARRRPGEQRAMVLEVVEGFTVECVRPGIGGDQHLSGRGYIARDVLR